MNAMTEQKHSSSGLVQAESRAIAEVQAAVVMAKRFPRDQIAALDRITNSFSRPSLAEVSQYQYSKGGSDVSGPSIRAAEAIAQQWGNIEFGFSEKSRGIGQDGVPFSEVEAYAWDLESLARKPLNFIVRHWRDTRQGGYQIKEERDIYELVANMAQRRVRACLLSIIPGDVTEAAMRQADVTLKTKADTSPEAMQKMVEAFEPYGVTKAQIEARIQRRLDAIQPAQVVSLKKIYASLRDGMSTAIDWFEASEGGADEKTLPAMSDDEFAKNLPAWTKAIEGKKKTAEQMIVTIESKNKLSDAQKKQLKAIGQPTGVAETAADQADIAAMRKKAEDFAISESDICKHLGVESLDGLTMAQLETATAYINNPAGE